AVQQELGISIEHGLTPEGVVQSRQRFGANRLTPLPREPLWKKFLEKFDEPIIKILLAAALLSMIVDLFTAERSAQAATGEVVVLLAVAMAYIFQVRQWVPSILFVATVALGLAGLATGHASWDGLAVMVAVILATGVAFLSEYKSDREFEVLNAQKDSLDVKVLRSGMVRTVPLEEV